MSRVYRNPPASNARRMPPRQSQSESPERPMPNRSTPNRPTGRGARASIRGRTFQSGQQRPERNDFPLSDDNQNTNEQERTVHIGEGFQMFSPSNEKREQMRRQAENEQREYEAHIERTRLRNIHEIHRLGGDGLSQEEVRRRQAEQYRREKFVRLEKNHQDQNQKKQEEEKEIEEKKQAARLQAIENEKRNRDSQIHSMRPNVGQGATGWTDEAREEDRRITTERFLNRLAQEQANKNSNTGENERENHVNSTNSEKLSILRDMLPQIDDQTLVSYLDIYDGNVDAIVQELLN